MNDDGVPNWMKWLVGVVVGALGGGWAAVQWWLNRKAKLDKERTSEQTKIDKARAERSAKIAKERRAHDEWVIEQSKGLVADLREQVEQLTDQVKTIQKEHIECRVELAKMTERVQRLEAEVSHLRGGAA